MTYIKLFLKNGFRFEGEYISETETHLTINDRKVGKTEILKSEIITRTENGGY